MSLLPLLINFSVLKVLIYFKNCSVQVLHMETFYFLRKYTVHIQNIAVCLSILTRPLHTSPLKV